MPDFHRASREPPPDRLSLRSGAQPTLRVGVLGTKNGGRTAAYTPPCRGRYYRVCRTAGSCAIELVFAGALFAGGGFAQTAVEDFYRGRQVNLIVGYGPGGGYDTAARLLARHLGRYVAGNPTIVAQNMPGAGSMRAANFLYSVAPRDGATFGLFGSDMPLIALVGNNPNVQFDPRKFTWIGSSSSFAGDAYILLVRPGAPARSIAEARRPGGPPLVLAGTGEGARDGDVPKILRDALALNIRQVLGYPDTPSICLAVERGEVDGRMFDFSYVKSSKPRWLEPASSFHILVQFARTARHPELPDVPTARELASGATARALIELSEAPLLSMARPFAAPPGVPEDRAQALRSAFLAVHRDPSFLAEAEKLGVDISPVSAPDLLIAIERMAHGSPDAFDYMSRLLAAHKGG
jgi:tripartite-type tricarboxylate transporter receptor subunit TctC